MVKLCCIGDSTSTVLSNGFAPVDEAASTLQLLGVRPVTVFNGAAGGLLTSDWYTTGAATARLIAFLATCGGTFGVTLIRLGVNDYQGSVSASTFNTNLTGIVNYVLANGGTPFLSYPLLREPGLFGENGSSVFTDDCLNTYFQSGGYISKIDALIDGSTIYAGDLTSLFVFGELPQTYYNYLPGSYSTTPGAIHENPYGAAMMGAAEGFAVLKQMGLATLGPPVAGGGILMQRQMTGGLA